MEKEKTYKDYEEFSPKINGWEVKDYEDKFKESVYYDVQFNKDGEYSMKLYKGESGVEATWTGTILLPGENYIKWTFSLQNGLQIDAKMTLDKENRDIFAKLFDFYDVWKQEWSKMLSVPQEKEEESELVKESLNLRKQCGDRNKKNIIDNFSVRMKKLAGL